MQDDLFFEHLSQYPIPTISPDIIEKTVQRERIEKTVNTRSGWAFALLGSFVAYQFSIFLWQYSLGIWKLSVQMNGLFAFLYSLVVFILSFVIEFRFVLLGYACILLLLQFGKTSMKKM